MLINIVLNNKSITHHFSSEKVTLDTCQDPISEEARLEFCYASLIEHNFI